MGQTENDGESEEGLILVGAQQRLRHSADQESRKIKETVKIAFRRGLIFRSILRRTVCT